MEKRFHPTDRWDVFHLLNNMLESSWQIYGVRTNNSPPHRPFHIQWPAASHQNPLKSESPEFFFFHFIPWQTDDFCCWTFLGRRRLATDDNEPSVSLFNPHNPHNGRGTRLCSVDEKRPFSALGSATTSRPRWQRRRCEISFIDTSGGGCLQRQVRRGFRRLNAD